MQLYLENMLPLINEVILYKSEFYRFVVGDDIYALIVKCLVLNRI